MSKLLPWALAALSLTGCLTDEQVDTSSTAGLSFEDFKARAGVETHTGAYVLDWDMVLHGEDALYDYWQQSRQGALSIHRQGGQDVKWSAQQAVNLTYCIGNSFTPQQRQLIVAAMTAATEGGWEKFANVDFKHVPGEDANCNAQNNNVVFDVNRVQNQPYLARAFFPNDPRQVRNVLFDTTAFGGNLGNGVTLTNVMIHELGHVLGFRHEHIRADQGRAVECPEDNNYRGVTAYDQQSTMHYPQCGSPNNTLALSPLDQQGVALVYGPPVVPVPPMALLNSPQAGQTVEPTFMVDAAVVDTDLVKADLIIDDVLYASKTTGPFQFEVTLAPGPHTLSISAVDETGLTTTTPPIAFFVAGGGDGDGGGGGNGGGGGQGDGGYGSNDLVGGCSTGGAGAGLALGLLAPGPVARRRR